MHRQTVILICGNGFSGDKMATQTPKIVVVGSTYVDMAIKCQHIPFPGQSLAGSALEYTIAGPGPLEAVQAALCGCNVFLISKIGGDCFGDMIKRDLARYNVNTDFLRVAEAKNTGVIATLVNSKGENACLTYCGANSALTAQDIDAADQLISEADLCLIHGHSTPEAIIEAIRLAKLYAKKVVLNPARPLGQAGHQPADLPIDYFSADVLIPNLYEAAEIADHADAHIRAAKLIGSELVTRGAGCAVITMGKRGCVVVDRDLADHIPAFEVELVDQTGRGDAFAGALAAFYAAHDNIREAVKFASAAAALTCTRFGTIEALPSKDEIIELLQKQES